MDRVSTTCILRLLALLFGCRHNTISVRRNEEDALAFFRVHQDKDKHVKAPTLYEALPVRNTTGREFYVERRAAHAVSDRALEAVVV